MWSLVRLEKARVSKKGCQLQEVRPFGTLAVRKPPEETMTVDTHFHGRCSLGLAGVLKITPERIHHLIGADRRFLHGRKLRQNS